MYEIDTQCTIISDVRHLSLIQIYKVQIISFYENVPSKFNLTNTLSGEIYMYIGSFIF